MKRPANPTRGWAAVLSRLRFPVRSRGLRAISSPLLCLSGIALASAVSAATWYVDKDAQGNNAGTSWANAWIDFPSIQWSSLNAGDTVYISGGHYTNGPAITKGGASNSPITLKVSREAGHEDDVYLHGTFSLRYDWITLDGSKDEVFPATWITNTVNVPLITNNIGLHVSGWCGISYTGSGPKGLRILWCDLSTPSDDAEWYGVRINASGAKDMEASEIAYCWIHDVGQDGIKQANGVDNPEFDQLVIHHCLIERVGDDGLEINQGTTVHHCLIRDTRRLHGHPDGIQSVGNYQRYYNNIISDFSSSYIVTQGVQNTNGGYGPIQIYGNLLYADRIPCSSTMVELKWFPMAWNVQDTIAYTNWIIANNTIVGSTNGNFGFYKRDNLLTNAHLRAIRWVNHITYDAYNWVGGIPDGRDNARTGLWDGPPGEVIFDYNVIAHGSRKGGARNQFGALDFSVFGTRWTSAEALNRRTPYTHNTSAAPQFLDEKNHDYRLAAEDTVARDTGMNLTALGLPGLDRDLFGNRRGSGRGWDRGAVEHVPSSPVVARPATTDGSAGRDPVR